MRRSTDLGPADSFAEQSTDLSNGHTDRRD
jgi:hypothetical protein